MQTLVLNHIDTVESLGARLDYKRLLICLWDDIN